jgi:hypothetical protein
VIKNNPLDFSELSNMTGCNVQFSEGDLLETGGYTCYLERNKRDIDSIYVVFMSKSLP